MANSETRCDSDHMGHFFFKYMKKIPNEICQIDAATGEEQTCASVLSRSIQLAQTFGRLGLVPGDPIVVAGRNHLDVHIPFYAALMTGQPVAGIDPTLKKNEIKHMLGIVQPKMIFCDYEYFGEYKAAVQELGTDTKIVTFGGGDLSFGQLIDTFQDLLPEDKFRVSIFNTDKVYCWLCSTSGSTGRPKVVAVPHSYVKQMHFFKMGGENDGIRRTALNLSTLHWISGCFNALLMPVNYVKVQTSAVVTTEHVIEIINKFKPAGTLCTPNLLAPILHNKNHCDLTCFDVIKMGGSKIHTELLTDLRTRIREDAIIHQAYGLTEIGAGFLQTTSDKPYGNIGKLDPNYEAKLVASETGKEIIEPNVTGELFVRGPTTASYYNDAKATKESLTDDGYFKTGDLFYKDEIGNYFFVDRLKMLLKYRSNQIVPTDVEEVILTHPGVADVCVTGVPHADDGEHVVACVVRQQGASVSAQEIKDHVAKHLSASKQLRGGVVFLDALPTTATGKIARLQVKRLVLTANRE